jgi:DNA-binding transcriptional ArsR family regulator
MSAEPAKVFAALGDPVRMQLVAALGSEGRSISDLARDLPISRQGVTKHLKVLEAGSLVRSERRGREVIWQGDPTGVAAARAALDEIGAGWEQSLHRLKALVEGRRP